MKNNLVREKWAIELERKHASLRPLCPSLGEDSTAASGLENGRSVENQKEQSKLTAF